MKFASKSWDLASLFVNGFLSYPGIYPNVYIASHVIPGIYVAAVAKWSQVYFKCVTCSLKYICFVCIMFLQTVIKELNLKIKIKENSHGIKRETIILQYCI